MSTLSREVNLLAEHAKQPSSLAPTRSATPPLLQLHIAGNALTLKPGLTYILGSAPEAHVHIGGSDVAPQHAKIAHDQLLTMQSALPTLLNGHPVGHGIATPLRDGDIIQLGTHQIRIGQVIEHDSSIQRHEHSTAIPSAQTLQAGNVNTHLLPSKDTAALHNSGMHGGQQLHDSDMQKLSLGDGTHKLAPGAGQNATHILPAGPAVTRELQPQQLHEQRTTLGQLAPGQTHTLPDGTTVHAGSQPTTVEQIRHEQPLQQQPQQLAATGPALARLGAHQKPEYVQHQPTTATTATAATITGPALARLSAHQQPQHTTERTHIEQQQQPMASTSAHSGITHNALELPTTTTVSGAGAPAFSDPAALVSAAAIPMGTTTHHQTSSSVPLSSSHSGSNSSLLGTGKADSYVLAPAFSDVELSSILADMLDLSGSHMSSQTREGIPHLLSLFAPAERQQMNSGHVKKWLHAAQEERLARLGSRSLSSSSDSTLAHHSASGAGVASTSSSTDHPVEAGSAARALGITSTDPKELALSDLLFAMLAMQAQQHGDDSHTLHGIHGNSSSAQLGAAKLASPAPLHMAPGADGAAGSTQTDYALLTLLSDMAEMGNWRLSSGWEAAVRYMLNEQHMSRSRRAQLSSSSQLKAWLRAAAADRDRSLRGRTQEPVVGAPAGGDISPLHLAQALIQQNHAAI